MVKRLTPTFRNALRYAAVSQAKLAEEAGYSRVTFSQYLKLRRPTRPAALALADALDARAERLRRYAVELREAAGDGAERDRVSASQPRR